MPRVDTSSQAVKDYFEVEPDNNSPIDLCLVCFWTTGLVTDKKDEKGNPVLVDLPVTDEIVNYGLKGFEINCSSCGDALALVDNMEDDR